MHVRVDQARHHGPACGVEDHDIGAGGELATVLGNFDDLILLDPQRRSRPQFRSLGIQEPGVLDDEIDHVCCFFWKSRDALCRHLRRTLLGSPAGRLGQARPSGPDKITRVGRQSACGLATARTAKCSFSQPGIPERNQLGEFLLLLGDPIRRPRFIPGAGVSGGLFDQLGDVLPVSRRCALKLIDRKTVVHRSDLWVVLGGPARALFRSAGTPKPAH